MPTDLTGPEHPDYEQYGSGPSPSLHHLNVPEAMTPLGVPSAAQRTDRRRPEEEYGRPAHLRDLIKRTQAEPELPPDTKLNEEWAHPAVVPHAERWWNKAFKGNLDDVQGYDEEWREMLHQAEKDTRPMSNKTPMRPVHSTAAIGAVSKVDKHNVPISTRDY